MLFNRIMARLVNDRRIGLPVYTLLLLVLSYLMFGCSGGGGSGFGEAQAAGGGPLLVKDCRDQAIACWSVALKHTTEIEAWRNPGVHVEVRVRLQGDNEWMWCRNVGKYTVMLHDNPYTPFGNNTEVYTDFDKFMDYITWYANIDRTTNYGG